MFQSSLKKLGNNIPGEITLEKVYASICIYTSICPHKMIYHDLKCDQTKGTYLPPVNTFKSKTLTCGLLKLLFKSLFLIRVVRVFLSHHLQGLDATKKKITPRYYI